MTASARIERRLHNPRDQIRLWARISSREAADIAGLCFAAGAAEFASALILAPRIRSPASARRAPH